MATQFKEIGRIQLNGTTWAVASKVIENGELKGVNFGGYVVTDKYTGYTKGGEFIPADKIAEFKDLVAKVEAN